MKHQVPIRTVADWDDAVPGFFEMNLVGHDGGRIRSDHAFTLVLTDVVTGWTELAALQNKAQMWTFEALKVLRHRLPFQMRRQDSDNDTEFINHHLVAYCQEQHLLLTRSRPWRKNDTCCVGQKNWLVVRRFVGYARYDTPAAHEGLEAVYNVLRDYVNVFFPSMKLIDKVRDGARVLRHHDTPQPPCRRLLNSLEAPTAVKKHFLQYYQNLNPAALHRNTRTLQQHLDRFGPTPRVCPEGDA